MFLGIDVGGTHTDAVVIDDGRIISLAKTVTDHDNLLRSVRSALEGVLADIDPGRVTRVNLSTTLSTNAIIEGKTEEVGVLLAGGPGIDPEYHRTGRNFFVLSGSVDHRGTVVQALEPAELEQAAEACREAGVKVFAAVGKFSTRNPAQEEALARAIEPLADFVTMGHRLSGVLNFPRRLATAHFNSAVWRIHDDFAWAVEESLKEYGLEAEVNVLKADGGTMPLTEARNAPVETILSGPAASVMGIIALCDIDEDSIILDVGGTTTDAAVFADGAPVVEKEGMRIGSYPTLVRSLMIRSIGVGGDSALHFSNGRVTVGPDRKGPSLAAADGETPTLTDALNYIGLSEFGRVEASRAGIKSLAEKWGLEPEDLAERAVAWAASRIREAALDLVWEINEKPVYTIHELLEGKELKPKKVYVMGGPAQALAERLQGALGLEVVLPEYFQAANAVGAALTRITMEASLFADTKKGRLLVPNLGVNREIPRDYDLERAQRDLRELMIEKLSALGLTGLEAEPDIVDAESFNMVEGPATTGRIIRVKAQVRPGAAKVRRQVSGRES